ncbi:MAG: endonuclease/exonuclease/phosphatase family protein [Sulfurospirillum sp.]|nr:endonuclease/exonuclease/phosphatase family protein [Sulfurospirillum sp.]
MFRFFFVSIALCVSLVAKDFRVAAYNVENLFDMQYNASEYKEYIPNAKSGWTQDMYNKKLSNLAKVIAVIDADIIALSEVESKQALYDLNEALGVKKYPYIFIQKTRANIKNALLSRYKIQKSKEHFVKGFSRSISELSLLVEQNELKLYLNHWPSYNFANESRLEYVKVLQKILKKKDEYIILGDLNSPLQIQKDGWGIGVNELVKNTQSLNLWLELTPQKRYSHVYKSNKKALDHIILSSNMQDGKKIEYKPKSFGVFAPDFVLDAKKRPYRWQISNSGKGKHLGDGFSDHLAIYADFSIY